MRKIIAILAFKLAQYYGPLRYSNYSKLLQVLLYFLMVTTSLFTAALTRLLLVQNENYILAVVVLSISIILLLGIYLGVKGGVMSLQSEIDFILVSNVKPRNYLLADLIFQLILLNSILTPSLLVFILIISRTTITNLINTIAMFELTILAAVMLSHVIGLRKSLENDRKVNYVAAALAIVFLFPVFLMAVDAVEFVDYTPLPQVILAKNMMGRGVVFDNLAVVVFFLCLLVIYYKTVNHLSSLVVVTPLLKTALVEVGGVKIVKIPSLLSIRVDESVLISGIKLHVIRIIRDRSILMVSLVALIFLMANMAFSNLMGDSGFSDLAVVTSTILYTAFIPAVLSINWGLFERDNLWVFQVVRDGIRRYAVSLMGSYFIVALLFSFILYVIAYIISGGTPFLVLDSLLAAAIPVFSSLSSVFFSFKLPRPGNVFSVSTLLHILMPMIVSVIFAFPVLVVRTSATLASEPPIPLVILLMAYLIGTAYVVYRRVIGVVVSSV